MIKYGAGLPRWTYSRLNSFSPGLHIDGLSSLGSTTTRSRGGRKGRVRERKREGAKFAIKILRHFERTPIRGHLRVASDACLVLSSIRRRRFGLQLSSPEVHTRRHERVSEQPSLRSIALDSNLIETVGNHWSRVPPVILDN